MTSRIPATLLLGLGLAACGGAAATAPDTAPAQASEAPATAETVEAAGPTLNVNTSEFEVDGIRVIHKNTPGNMIVSASLRFDGGATTWTRETAGAHDLALTVITEGGPADMTRSSFAAALDGRGSSIGGSVDYDMMSVSMSSIAPEFEATWNLMIRALRDPAWRDNDIALARERQLTSIRTAMDDPDTALGRLARMSFFEGQAYGHPTDGYEDTVEAFTTDDLQRALDELMVRNRITVVVVGHVDRETVERLVREGLGDLPVGEAPSVDTPPVAHDAPALFVDERPQLPTNYMLGYYTAPNLNDPDYAALNIATEILSDRLFEEVRTRRNLSYAVAAGLATRRSNTGYLYVTAVDPDTTLQVMYDTIDAMIEEPVPVQDLADQIEGYLTRYYMGLQTNSTQNGALATWTLVAGDRLRADDHIEQLRAVTPDDVSRVLAQYVRNVQWVVIGDPAEVDAELFQSR